MKRILFTLFTLLLVNNIQAQCDGRYQQEIFDDVIVSTVTYSDVTNLQVDIYEAIGDDESNRPLIILAHGGAFIAGTRTNPSMVSLGETFAKRGYVVASISYRLMSFLDLTSATSALNGVAEALSDGRAAVRYFRKTVEEGNVYNIDPNQIYFGGNSAGGVMAVHAAFMQESDITNAELITALNNNGGIEGNSGNEGYSSQVRGAISLAGGIADVNFITLDDAGTLLISCHGEDDTTVPYLCGQPLSNPVLPQLCGGGAMLEHTEAIDFGSHYHLEFEGAGHVPWEFGGSSEVAMINFVSEHLYNDLDCSSVGVAELERTEKPLIFPNPTESKFSIRSLKRIYKVVISNLKGVVLFKSENSASIDIEHLPKGIYMVEVLDENQKITRSKVVKM
jgi:poly(3-hydroxybutyrate) depolymerase